LETSGYLQPQYSIPAPYANPPIVNRPMHGPGSHNGRNGYRTDAFQMADPNVDGTSVEIAIRNRHTIRERAVQTGDDRDITIPIILLSVGVVLIVAAEIYRRKKKKAKKDKE